MGSSENKTHTHKLTHTNAWTTNRHIHKQKERSRKYPRKRARALHLQWEHLLGSVNGEMEPALESSGHELSWGC